MIKVTIEAEIDNSGVLPVEEISKILSIYIDETFSHFLRTMGGQIRFARPEEQVKIVNVHVREGIRSYAL